MNLTTPYTTLGIDPSATEDEIKKAFKDLAMRHHRDKNRNDPEASRRFQNVQIARDVLLEENIEWKPDLGKR